MLNGGNVFEIDAIYTLKPFNLSLYNTIITTPSNSMGLFDNLNSITLYGQENEYYRVAGKDNNTLLCYWFDKYNNNNNGGLCYKIYNTPVSTEKTLFMNIFNYTYFTSCSSSFDAIAFDTYSLSLINLCSD